MAGEDPLPGGLLEALFAQRSVGVAVVQTRTGRLLRVNDRYAQLLGRSTADVVGETVYAITPADALEALVGLMVQTVRDCSSGSATMCRMRADGRAVSVRIMLTPLFRADAAAERHLELMEAAESDDRERRLAADLDAARRGLEVFAYGASHELRAPLRAIDGFARMFEEKHRAELSDDARGCLGRVREGARIMARLIDDLARFARVDRRVLAPERVDVRRLIEGAWDALARERVGRRVELRIEALPDCVADAGLLYEAMHAVLANALKFSRCRTVAHVEVFLMDAVPGPAAHGSHPWAAYCIRDDGVGFEPRFAERIFEPFQRLHPPDEYQGSGLGLSLVRRVIERHGGLVRAEGMPDGGATVYLCLPPSAFRTSAG